MTTVDFHEPPAAEDQADAELLAEAKRRGYRLACRCLDCSRWLVAAKSVFHHRGPVCRRRVQAPACSGKGESAG